MSTGTVGKPMTGLEVKLVNWEEGSYRTSDKPRPRGKSLSPKYLVYYVTTRVDLIRTDQNEFCGLSRLTVKYQQHPQARSG